jgi:hypothetical protein
MFEVVPQRLTLRYQPGASYHREIRITPRPDSHFIVQDPTSNRPDVRVRLSKPTATDPGYRLALDIGPLPGPGDFEGEVSLPTNAPLEEKIYIPIVGVAQSGPVATPSKVERRAPGKKGEVFGRFQVITRSGKVHVLSAGTADRALRAELDPHGDAGCEVRLIYLGGWKPGMIEGLVEVRTDDRRFPSFNVPYRTLMR